MTASESSIPRTETLPAGASRLLLGTGRPRWLPYAGGLLLVAAATASSFLLFGLVDFANIIMMYLLAVVLAAVGLGRGPSVAASILGVASFVYFFVPHYWSFVLSDLRYLPTLAIMLFVALTVSTLTSRLQTQIRTTQVREERNRALYLLSRGLAAAESREHVDAVVREHVQRVLRCRCELLEPADGTLQGIHPGVAASDLQPDARAVAARALDARSTLRHGGSLFVPMVVAKDVVGLLHCFDLEPGRALDAAELLLLESFANNAAIALHRLVVGEEAAAVQRSVAQERLRNVMLRSMSHDYRTPLASITGAITTLIDGGTRLDAATSGELMQSIRQDAEFLERQVRNMLELTRLESDLEIRREWHPIDEVVGSAMTRLEPALAGRRVDVDVARDMPLAAIDALLVERLLVNLVENALRHAPGATPIEVRAWHEDGWLRIDVADRGPGIPADQHERVFEKFHRLDRSSRRPGSGLGLTICRAIAHLHGGRIRVEDRPGGGALLRVAIPLVGPQPSQPPDLEDGVARGSR